MRAIRIQDRCHWVSRRAFLGGASVMLALPALETLSAKFAVGAAAKPPLRFLSWYFPCGVARINTWPTLLGGLDVVKGKYSVLQGMQNTGGGPDHSHGTRAYLTGGYEGASFDQVLADTLAASPDKAPVHSVQFGAPDKMCDGNVPCTFCDTVSWRSGGVALLKQNRPDLAFNDLFNGVDPNASAAASKERDELDKSVLDVVLKDSQKLATILSANDKLTLDDYMTSVRETELRIGALGPAAGGAECGVAPAGLTGSAAMFQTAANNRGHLTSPQLEAVTDAFIEVMALALRCDITRVVSYMTGSGGSVRQNLGTNENYHVGIGHADKIPEFNAVVSWEMEKFGKLLGLLDKSMEADGTSVLDNLVAFSSSEICEGVRHNHDNMPVILAGGLGGKLKLGTPVQVGNKFVDLFAFIAEQMGAPVTGFGNAGMIKGLTA